MRGEVRSEASRTKDSTVRAAGGGGRQQHQQQGEYPYIGGSHGVDRDRGCLARGKARLMSAGARLASTRY